jgi:hypothetical protein
MSSGAIRAGAAYIELFLRDKVTAGLKDASRQLRSFGDAVAWQGAKIAAAGAAITAPLVAMAHASIDALAAGGPGIDPKDAAAAREYTKALEQMNAGWVAIRNAIASAVLPALTKMAQLYAAVVERTAVWAQKNRELIGQIFTFGTYLALAGAAISVLGVAISQLGTVFSALATVTSVLASAVGVLGGVLAFIVTPLGLIVAAAAAAGAALLYFSGAGAAAIDWLKAKFGELWDEASASFAGIADALAAGNIELAAQIFWLTLKMEWQKGIDALNHLWVGLKTSLMQTWNDVVFGIAHAWNDGWALVETGLVDTIAYLTSVLDDFQARFRKGWGSVTDEIAKGMLEVQGMFDPTLDVEQAKAMVDEDRRRINQGIDAGVAGRGAEREAGRQQRVNDIERRRADQNNGLGAAQAEREAEMQKAFDRELAATGNALAAAKAALRQAIDQAAAERKAVDDKRAQIGEVAAPIVKSLEAKGTFNASAIRGMGADSLAERTAKATEEGAAGMRKLIEMAQRGRLVFGA